MGLPGRSLHLLALPPLLPPVKGDHPRGRVLLPGGHHPGLHLPRPGGGPHHQQQHQPAQLPDRQPEAAAGVAGASQGGLAAGWNAGGGATTPRSACRRQAIHVRPTGSGHSNSSIHGGQQQQQQAGWWQQQQHWDATCRAAANSAAPLLLSASSSSRLLSSTVLAPIMQALVNAEHTSGRNSTARCAQKYESRRNPYFGCDEAHSDLT